MIGLPGGVPVVISPYLPEDEAYVVDGRVVAGSMSAVFTQIERERRRADAYEAFMAMEPVS